MALHSASVAWPDAYCCLRAVGAVAASTILRFSNAYAAIQARMPRTIWNFHDFLNAVIFQDKDNSAFGGMDIYVAAKEAKEGTTELL